MVLEEKANKDSATEVGAQIGQSQVKPRNNDEPAKSTGGSDGKLESEANSSTSFKVAKVIRYVSVPPVVMLVLSVVLFALKPEFFAGIPSFVMAILSLTIVPTLAYPIHRMVPKLHATGRPGQRKVAFVFTGVGYTMFFLYSIIAPTTSACRVLGIMYFLTVVALIFVNKVVGYHASGHSAGVTSPILFFIYEFGLLAVIPCVVFMVLVIWSSLKTKRHTAGQLASGIIITAACFFIALGIVTALSL